MTSDDSPNQNSLADGAGCALLLMGVVGGAFGLAALTGISDRVELEFFGIELNDLQGRLIWVAGCLIAFVAGVLLLRRRRGT